MPSRDIAFLPEAVIEDEVVVPWWHAAVAMAADKNNALNILRHEGVIK
ncbi:hypothetical protein [Filimonas effusa]|nr:hypothetical protein [Filimonas effusa]